MTDSSFLRDDAQPDSPVHTVGVKALGGRHDLTSGPILGSLVIFSLPVLGSTALQSLNGSVNNFWVSHTLGVNAVTAIGNANIVMMLLLGGVMGVSMAVNILIAQRYGAGDIAAVKQAIGTAVSFFTVLALTVAALGYFFSPNILRWMATPSSSIEQAESYLRIVFLSMPFLYFFNFLQMAQRGLGDSQTPFWFMLVAVALDITLNPLLIRGVGPFPKLGIAGSATSTFIAQGLSLFLLVLFLRWKQSPLILRWSERSLLRPNVPLLRSLISRGLPMGLQMLVMSGSAVIMISFVNSFGAVTSAAYAAASQVWGYAQMPAMAVGSTISSMAAQNIGAGKWDRVSRIAWIGVLLSMSVTAAVCVCLYLTDSRSLGLFLPAGSESLPIAVHVNQVVLWSFVLFAVTFALTGVIRSTGSVMPSLIILGISMFVVRIPFAKLRLPKVGADAVWWSFPLGIGASSLFTLLYYAFGSWRKAKVVDAHVTGQASDTGRVAPTNCLPAHLAHSIFDSFRHIFGLMPKRIAGES